MANVVSNNVSMETDDDEWAMNTDLREHIEKALEAWLLPTGTTEQDESIESGAWMRWMALVPPKTEPSKTDEPTAQTPPAPNNDPP